jgi:thiol-disulfide isomerase/thioredoxin
MNKLLTRTLLLLTIHLGMAGAYAGEKIHSFAPDSFSQIVASHTGKPFVVLVWGLDCEYCLASFNALAEAQRKHKFSVVTIAIDRVDDAEATSLIKKNLEASGLGTNMWAFSSAPPEQLRYAIDPKWRGETPRSYWFNARAERVAHSGVITSETVAKLLPK